MRLVPRSVRQPRGPGFWMVVVEKTSCTKCMASSSKDSSLFFYIEKSDACWFPACRGLTPNYHRRCGVLFPASKPRRPIGCGICFRDQHALADPLRHVRIRDQHRSPILVAHPSTGMLDNIKVESYGSMTTLASVAQASMKGPQLIVLTVYDPGVRSFLSPYFFSCVIFHLCKSTSSPFRRRGWAVEGRCCWC